MLTGSNSLQVETVLSTPRTELTELQSRKTSLALSSSFESQAAVQIKEWNYLDPWEFPRSVLNSHPPPFPLLSSFPDLPLPLNSSFPSTPPSSQLLLVSIFPASQLLLTVNSSFPRLLLVAVFLPINSSSINSSFTSTPPSSQLLLVSIFPANQLRFINSSFLQNLPPAAPIGLTFSCQ